jgi:hypothetical protein
MLQVVPAGAGSEPEPPRPAGISLPMAG